MAGSEDRGPTLAPHQRTAVERLTRILALRRGAVLADEPGLGKTFVAAAVAADWLAKGVPVEVVTPSPLRGYWRGVLRGFGVEATIMSHELLARELARRDWRRETRLVIVDEAHRFRNPLTRRYEGLARMSINARLLLVTATPACNSPSDLLSLLRLVVADDELEDQGVSSLSESFASCGETLDVVMDELVVRRSVGEVEGATPTRREETMLYEPMADLHELRRSFESLTFPWVSRRVTRDLLILFLQRRLESSVAALAATIRRMARICRRARHLASKGAMLSATELRRVLGDPDTESYQDILFPALWGAEVGECPVSEREFDEEERRLDGIVRELASDPKLERLAAIVRERVGTPGLVFTVSWDTAVATFDEMSRHIRCALLTGRGCAIGGRRADIDGVVRALREGEVDLIVATDVGGEGLNLETAGYVVHYDQPWNPAVIEQRNGRICRIGQLRREVETIELVVAGSRTRGIVRQKRASIARLWTRPGARGDGLRSGRGMGWRPPSCLDAGRSQVRLVDLLRARGLSSGEIVDLLSMRHREGVERWLDRFARMPVDAAGVERLRELLQSETALIPRGAAKI